MAVSQVTKSSQIDTYGMPNYFPTHRLNCAERDFMHTDADMHRD